jgi:hypothetical protein
MLTEAVAQVSQFPEILEADPEAAQGLRLIDDCRKAFARQMP